MPSGAKRSVAAIHRLRGGAQQACQLLSGRSHAPQRDFEVICGDAVWTIWRRAEGDGEVAEHNVEEVLMRGTQRPIFNFPFGAHLEMLVDVEFDQYDMVDRERQEQVPRILLSLRQLDVGSDEVAAHLLEG